LVQDNFNPYVFTSKNLSSTSRSAVSTEILSQIGSIHDIESSNGSSLGIFPLSSSLFTSHWGHLSVIFSWASALYFHIAWTGNYELWILNPLDTLPIAHSVSDPQFGNTLFDSCFVESTSGLYHILLTVGVTVNDQIYAIALSFQLLSLTSLLLSYLSSVSLDSVIETVALEASPSIKYLNKNKSPLYRATMRTILSALTSPLLGKISQSFHLNFLLAFTSLLWGLHLVYFSDQLSPSLTFKGGLDPMTNSLYVSDIAHHHIAISGLLFWGSSLSRSISAATGLRASDLTRAAAPLSFIPSQALKSIHAILGASLISLSILSLISAYTIYSVPVYKFISFNSVTVTSIFSHHIWISLFLVMGACAHFTIYIIRDVSLPSNALECSKHPLIRLINSKAAVISHLSYVSLFLGFHTLGLYIHNDCVSAFGHPSSQILIEPILFRQSSSDPLSIGLLDLLNLIVNVLSPSSSFIRYTDPCDLLVAHAVSLGLHVTLLIILKGAFDSKGSRILPDKSSFGYAFPCDGPGRGGSCDISSWDAFYLAFFWALNSTAWFLFNFHWHQLVSYSVSPTTALPSGGLSNISSSISSASTLNGWFRDYLWFNSSSLIRGYDPSGSNDLGVWAWTFLLAHLCWAVSFMFLISWRGYWQELIDSIVYLHLKTPFLSAFWTPSFSSPVALSIVQARFIGLSHFSVGYILTYAAFLIASSE